MLKRMVTAISWYKLVQGVATWCSLVQRGAAQRVAACGGVLQCTAVFNRIVKRIVIEGGA